MGERRNEEKLADTGTPFDPSTKLRVVSLPFDALSFAQGHEPVEWSNHKLRAGGDTGERQKDLDWATERTIKKSKSLDPPPITDHCFLPITSHESLITAFRGVA